MARRRSSSPSARRAFLTLAAAALASTAAATVALAQYPEKGRPITVIVPFAAGGPSDVGVRLLIPFLERDLGTSFQVVNKPGASTQTGVTELTRARPDGYTVALVPPPTTAMTYLDAERKAPYGRKDIQPVAGYTADANLVVVPANSPFKTLKDFVEAARARPKQIRFGTSGLMTSAHFAGIALEEVTGVRFAFVHFQGAAPEVAALLGGNLDAGINGILATMPHERAGAIRVLATMDSARTKFFPDAPTTREQGYEVLSPVTFGFIAPGGTPLEIVDRLGQAISRAMEDPGLTRRLEEVALYPDYKDRAKFEAFWSEIEARTKSLLALAKQRQE